MRSSDKPLCNRRAIPNILGHPRMWADLAGAALRLDLDRNIRVGHVLGPEHDVIGRRFALRLSASLLDCVPLIAAQALSVDPLHLGAIERKLRMPRQRQARRARAEKLKSQQDATAESKAWLGQVTAGTATAVGSANQ